MPKRLPSSPTPKNFADAVADQVKPAIDRLAGNDGRISRSEAKKAPGLQSSKSANVRAAVDNVERYFRGSHKQKPSSSKVVEHVRKDAAKAARGAAGDDGRLSAADAEKGLPAHLYDNFVALRAGGSKKASEPSDAPAADAATPSPAVKPKPAKKPKTVPASRPAADAATPSPAVKPPSKKPKTKPGSVPASRPADEREFDTVTMARVRKGAKLLKDLLAKADNGDETLTQRELDAALANGEGGWQPDGITVYTLQAAVFRKKSKGDRSLAGILTGVDEAVAELEKIGGGAALDRALLKKTNTRLAEHLARFAWAHAGERPSEFRFSAYNEPIYVPQTPFRAPRDADALTLVQALVDHFNSYSNDNSMHGPRPQSITRFVLGPVETQGIADEIAKLGRPEAKAALRELDRRIHQADSLGGEMSSRRVWVEPKAQPIFTNLASGYGLDLDFEGKATAPKFDYY